MSKQVASNTFQEGLLMDMNPLITPNTVTTNCLNGTLVTYNGNENTLQNDMGNGRVETAYLPEGYVPLGTAELGGIIYIVSYNPLSKKCQIGSFPSPERNITSGKISKGSYLIDCKKFYKEENSELIVTDSLIVLLTDKELNPGDKFWIYSDSFGEKGYISAKEPNNYNPNKFPRHLKFNILAIPDKGNSTNLNDSLVWYDDNNYYIREGEITNEQGDIDLDEYRGAITPNYSVFASKISGRLAIQAKLECISNFDVAWDAIKDDEGNWILILLTNWEYDNLEDRNKINLYNIGYTINTTDDKDIQSIGITTYPKSNPGSNNIIGQENVVFYTPDYIEDITSVNLNNLYQSNKDIPRRNDGTDNQFLIKTDIELVEGENKITIYPGMPFGYLDYMKKSFTINTADLGSGKIKLVEYRYLYNNDGSVTLNWGLDAYPEQNKKIRSVKFNFYKYSEDLQKVVKNNGSNIDNYRIKSIDGKYYWNDEAHPEQNGDEFSGWGQNVETEKTHTVAQATSYSGNFSETIRGLDKDSLYLVEIAIDYNGNYTYTYCRFLYTCPIFNKYYYQETDYKNIKLQDALEIQHQATNLQESVKEHTLILKIFGTSNENIGKDDYKEPTLDSVIVSTEPVANKKYSIVTQYKSGISFDIESNVKSYSDTFKVNVANLECIGSNITEFVPDSKQTYISNTSTSISSEVSLEVTSTKKAITGFSFTGQHFSSNLDLLFETPFEISYSNPQEEHIDYMLENLSISPLYLLFTSDEGTKHDNYLYVSQIYGKAANSSNKYNIKDDYRISGNINYYNTVYDKLKSELQGNDVLALMFGVHHEAKNGGQGAFVIFGQGDAVGDGKGNVLLSKYWASYSKDEKMAESNIPLLPVYAMLDTSGEVQLYTFAKGIASLNNLPSVKWYGTNTKANTGGNFNGATGEQPLVFKKSDLTPEIAMKPFTNYYKAVPCSQSTKVAIWNRLYYFNNYSWELQFEIACTGKVTISINECDIPVTEETSTSKLPLNLQYSPSENIKVKGSVSNRENFNRYIDSFLQSNSKPTLALLPDNSVVVLEIGENTQIYNKNGKIENFLVMDNGDNFEESPDSRHALRLREGMLRIKNSTISANDMISIIGRAEEQAVTITNVIKINK